jgi:tRNA nucleotidyltransferase (CCA-adding enzyme)
MRDVYSSGLTKVFFPEFDAMMECDQVNKHHMYSVGEHTIVSMGLAPADKVIRLAMLLHDIGKPSCKTADEKGQNHFKLHPVKGAEMAKTVLRRLKFDNDTTDRVCNLVKNHDDRPEINQRNVRRMIIRVGQENMPDLFAVKRADCMAQSMYHREEKLAYIAELEQVYNEILEAKDCLRIKDLKVNGKDLIAMGVPQGQRIGEVLGIIFDRVVDEPSLNDREVLLKMVQEIIQ